MTKLTMQQYQQAAQRTSPDDGHDRIQNALFGLLGETGEIADLWKKYKFQSTPETPMPGRRMLEEAGDVMWYLAELAAGLDDTLDAIIGAESFEDFDCSMLRRRNSMRNRDIPRIILTLAGEANEICYHTRRKDWKRVKANMKKMMVAIGALCMECGECTSAVARANIEKLKRRYPAGFDAKISMGRYE